MIEIIFFLALFWGSVLILLKVLKKPKEK